MVVLVVQCQRRIVRVDYSIRSTVYFIVSAYMSNVFVLRHCLSSIVRFRNLVVCVTVCLRPPTSGVKLRM